MHPNELSAKQAGLTARQATVEKLKQKGPSLDRTLLRLRQSLNAKETKVVKLKGSLNKDHLPKGFEHIVSTGTMVVNDDGIAYGDGDSLLKYDVVAHGPRLKAIELALALYDAMPSQRHEHNLHADPGLVNAIIDGIPTECVESVVQKLDQYVSGKRPK